MKILIIDGSLRNGNTKAYVDNIMKIVGINHQFHYLSLKDISIGLCKGCYLCFKKGEQFCPHKDEIANIIARMDEVDGIICASPTHSMNVSWIIKNFMDRISYIMHRPKFFDKKFMLLVLSGSIRGGKDAMRSLRFLKFGGKIITEAIVLNSPGMNENKLKIQNNIFEKKVREFFKTLEKNKKNSIPITYLIWFSAMKAMSIVSKNENVADYNYYIDKNYFAENSVNPIQKVIIIIVNRFFSFLIKKGYV
jgi:multimeric flavodoxin WrbA